MWRRAARAGAARARASSGEAPRRRRLRRATPPSAEFYLVETPDLGELVANDPLVDTLHVGIDRYRVADRPATEIEREFPLLAEVGDIEQPAVSAQQRECLAIAGGQEKRIAAPIRRRAVARHEQR